MSKACCKYPGVFVNNKLTFVDHIQKVKMSLSRQCGLVSKMRYFVPRSVVLKYYACNIKPIIQYGLLVFAFTSFSKLNAILLLQMKIRRLIFFRNSSDSVSQLSSDNEILTVNELYLLDLLKVCFRVANKIHGHEVFGHYFLIKSPTRVTRSSLKTVFETPVCISKLKGCSIKNRGVKLLNTSAENNLRKNFGEMTDFQISDYVHRLKNMYILGNYDLVRCVFE